MHTVVNMLLHSLVTMHTLKFKEKYGLNCLQCTCSSRPVQALFSHDCSHSHDYELKIK